MLVLFALSLTMLLGMVALALDGGNLLARRRRLQSAADAAALAAVAYLPWDGATCTGTTNACAAAQRFSSRNGGPTTLHACNDADHAHPTDTNYLAAPYFDTSGVSHPDAAEVRLMQVVAGAVTKAAGLPATFNVTARAVSRLPSTGGEGAAIFAGRSQCSDSSFSLKLDGNNVTINGTLTSNGSVNIHGNNQNHFDELDWRYQAGTGSNVGCVAPDIDGAAPTTSTQYTAARAYPYTYDRASIPCTYSAPSFSLGGNNVTIPAVVYCATGAISVSGNVVSGNVTLIAKTIDFGGNDGTFSPYYNNLLFYAYGSSPTDCDTFAAGHACLTIHGNDINYNAATFYVPNGVGISAYLEADTVSLHGNNTSWQDSGPASGGTVTIAMIE